ncbi:hypothetical protein B0F90DRAFT_1764546, partial [Multifurca ochricompacta]
MELLSEWQICRVFLYVCTQDFILVVVRIAWPLDQSICSVLSSFIHTVLIFPFNWSVNHVY